jgi:hypothetical protein
MRGRNSIPSIDVTFHFADTLQSDRTAFVLEEGLSEELKMERLGEGFEENGENNSLCRQQNRD